MSRNRTSVIVIGGGVIGAAAAWRLAAQGHEVTLVEQFGPVHAHGASHGSARIFRHAYPDRRYVDLAARAATGWQRLERTTGRTVYTRTGAIDHGDPAAVQRLARTLGAAGLAFEILGASAAGRRWPGLRFDTVVLHHPAAGRLDADSAVSAFWLAAETAGATTIRERVRQVRTKRAGVEVVTDTAVLTADQTVVAAGAWTADLLGDLLPLPALVTTQEQPLHLDPLQDTDPWPAFIHHPGSELQGEGIYGLLSPDGVKVGEHGTGPRVDPDQRPDSPDPDGVARVRAYARSWLPGVDADAYSTDSCLYTTTPDHAFVIDRQGPITVAAGFSGHGFKFAPAIGDLVADLVEGRRGGSELFSLQRTRTPVELAG